MTMTAVAASNKKEKKSKKKIKDNMDPLPQSLLLTEEAESSSTVQQPSAPSSEEVKQLQSLPPQPSPVSPVDNSETSKKKKKQKKKEKKRRRSDIGTADNDTSNTHDITGAEIDAQTAVAAAAQPDVSPKKEDGNSSTAEKNNLNNKNDDDPSKWSKSKKKRMRMKKAANKKYGGTVTNESSRDEESSAPNNVGESNDGTEEKKDSGSPKAFKTGSDCTDHKNGSKRNSKKHPTIDEQLAAVAINVSTIIDDKPKMRNDHDVPNGTESSNPPTLNDTEQKKKKKEKKEKKRTRDEAGQVGPASTTAVANSDNVEEESPNKVALDSQKLKRQPNILENDNKKRKVIEDMKLNRIDITETLPRPGYTFKVDDTDHCETPLQAYQDVIDILDQLVQSLCKTRSSLRIYDPYYCDGGIKKKLASIGFTNVINNNRDFYMDIAKKTTPEYDVLVTNPPYSGVHMGKLLGYCKQIATEDKKPFLLLLPHYVYTKDYYQLILGKMSSSMFFLVPIGRYSYIPPSWVTAGKGSKALDKGKIDTAPFPSFWYCHAGNQEDNAIISSKWLVEKFGPSGMVRPKHHSNLRYAKSPKDIPRDFRGEFDPNNKRANPKARKRAAKMRREAAWRAGGSWGGCH